MQYNCALGNWRRRGGGQANVCDVPPVSSRMALALITRSIPPLLFLFAKTIPKGVNRLKIELNKYQYVLSTNILFHPPPKKRAL